MLKFYNVDATIGGPIAEDRVWFFAASRAARNKNTVPGPFFNTSIGSPTFEYTPDESRKAYRTEWMRSVGGRITWQASERNKIGVFADFQSFFNRGRGEFYSPEAFVHQYNLSPEQLYQTTWTSPVSSRLLLEAGFSNMRGRWPYPSPGDGEFASAPDAVHLRELTTGFRWNARQYYSDHIKKHRYSERGSLSYVTGSHAFKAGFQLEHGISEFQQEIHGDVWYHLRNGLPSRITQHATYADDPRKEHLTPLGIFVQDQWTLPRMTLNLGVRFDRFNGRVPAQSFRATRFVPAREYAEIADAVRFTDINPRIGVAYDLAGSGRTALKFALGRYVETALSGLVTNLNPLVTSVNSVTRTWNDDNLNFVPDCALTNFGQNGECGPISDLNFGLDRPGATIYDDSITQGFGNRNYTWDMSAEVVHELAAGVSLTAGYYRNWAGNWRARDNILVGPEDFDPYCVTAPMHPQLPGGGGYEICGLYDISPEKFGQNQTVATEAGQFISGAAGVTCGEQRTSSGRAPFAGRNCGTSDFFGVNIDTRFLNGAQLGGGFDTGRTVINTCFTIDSPQALLNCDTRIPFSAHHNFKMFGSYPLPYDISFSGSFRTVAGRPIDADWRVPNDLIAPSLGRNLAACGTRTECTSHAPFDGGGPADRPLYAVPGPSQRARPAVLEGRGRRRGPGDVQSRHLQRKDMFHAPDQSLLLPPDGNQVLVDDLDLTAFYVPYEGDGRRNAPYEPRMMVKVLLYAYATGVFSSRRIARKLEEDVAFRVLAAGNFPQHRTLCEFRRRHLEDFQALFVEVGSTSGSVPAGSCPRRCRTTRWIRFSRAG